MGKSPDFSIEIERSTRVLGIEEPITEILGSVPNEPGKYPVKGMDVQVCRTIYPDNSSLLQKVIVREVNSRRRVALVHHNTDAAVVQDLSLVQRLAFRVRRGGVMK